MYEETHLSPAQASSVLLRDLSVYIIPLVSLPHFDCDIEWFPSGNITENNQTLQVMLGSAY